jgi:glyoxylase-like metal-dependent hydrolase (beta-lactamase superfamily II)
VTLDLLVPGVYAWLQLPTASGRANAGVVIDQDGVTVIDTLLSAPQWTPLAAAVEALGFPVRRVVLTSSNAEYSGGTARFRTAAIYGRPQASTHLDQPADPATLRRLYPAHAEEIDDEFATRPVSHVVDGPVQLTPAVALVPMTGQQEENLVAHIPAAEIVFAGAMCSFGVTPMAHQGDPAKWADALDDLIEIAPIVVPGHGPIGGEEEVRELQAYLRSCVDAEGDVASIGAGPWDTWSAREHDIINVERAAMLAMGDDGIPPALLRMLGLE